MEERQPKRPKFTEASSSSTSAIGNNYYVFLSFRGSDTRKSFTDHLYHRLVEVGLHRPNFVFRDDENLRFGEPIADNLLSAIEHSKVSIPVISENYAASEWCLRELIHIMKCKESKGQKVLPVLYKVKPKDVKHMLGKFGEAFKSSMHRFKEDVKQQGPEALKKALTLRVYESGEFANGCEGELVKGLVRIIMGEQQQDFLPPLPGNLVGIDHRVAEVMKLVDIDASETRIIGICGIGGTGKTTLATVIYNKLSKKFECRSFLLDIRETINRNGMEHVQALLILDITKNHESRVRDSMTGIGKIRSSCEKKKVLILLDDVGYRDHIDKLIGGCNFESGSRIIITCRDKALLKSEYKCYELEEMNAKDSMLLFSLYAFEAKQPPAKLASLSRDIVATTGGLPLALEIIGSYIKGKDEVIWIETLQKLRKVPNMDVKEKLKISYYSLGDEEKRMFLDIACFFIGIDKRIVAYQWKDLDLYPASGLARMIELSLIKYGYNNELRMHDQLRDLGRDIARSAAKKPWKCSRLWDEEATKVLGRKKENENIEALRLNEKGSKEFMKQESFKRMPNLKFLHLSAMGFAGDFEGSLSELRWLKWERCCDTFEATNIHLEKLIILDLSSDNIRENWRGWSSIKMERLKVLDLTRCLGLKSTPNLYTFKNLEMLILKNCACLMEIHPSIGDVKHLVSLSLEDCYALQQIPSSIGKLGELVELYLARTSITELPESIGELNKLKILGINQSKIKRLPSSIGKLQSLQGLYATCCCDLEGEIHVDKGGLSSLKTLCLHGTKISRLPENISELSSLEHLDLFLCRELQSLPKPPVSLSYLSLTCRSNELPPLSHLKHLKELHLTDCKSLQSIPSLSHLNHLKELHLQHCSSLQSIPSLSHLNHLKVLWLAYCTSLQSIPSLSHLKHLKELHLCVCKSLQSIPELPSCIQTLHVWKCPKLERLPKLFDLEFLSKLWLADCYGPKELDGLEALKSLRELNLSIESKWADDFDEDKLHAIEGLEKLGSLEVLNFSGRKHIQVLDLSKSEHLKWLDVKNCKSLVEIRCPSKFLNYFDRNGCESLQKFPDFLPPT